MIVYEGCYANLTYLYFYISEDVSLCHWQRFPRWLLPVAGNPARGKIAAQTVGVDHVVVSAKAAKDRLAEPPDKIEATVLPTPGVHECVSGNLDQSERIIQFPVRQQPSVGRDLGAVEFQFQAAAEIDPKAPLFRFSHRVRHDHLTQFASTI